MKITVRTEDGTWLETHHTGCRPDHRHYAARVGRKVVLNCERFGPMTSWADGPVGRGTLVTEVEVPETAKCRRCGKKLKSGATGTVHASSGLRSCY